MMNLFLSYIIFFSCNFFALNAFDSVSKRRIFRIVGGYPTSIEQNPYMVCILREGSMHCGGTLVKSDVVLTAAHCVYSQEEWMNTRTLTAYPARDITVLIGSSYSKSTNDENALLRNVTEVIGHEYFEFSYMQNDIALLKLSQPVDISPKVQLVKLIANRPAIGTVCTALGWGISKSFAAHETPTGPSAEVLYEVDLSVISLSDCGKTMPKVTYQSICTYTPGKDACVGDSGGPLMCSGYQAGIISYGIGCAAKYKPGVFQRIDIHFKWLRAHGSAPSQQRPLPVPLALLLSLPAAAPLTTVLCF